MDYALQMFEQAIQLEMVLGRDGTISAGMVAVTTLTCGSIASET
jgi:hypothetical protein